MSEQTETQERSKQIRILELDPAFRIEAFLRTPIKELKKRAYEVVDGQVTRDGVTVACLGIMRNHDLYIPGPIPEGKNRPAIRVHLEGRELVAHLYDVGRKEVMHGHRYEGDLWREGTTREVVLREFWTRE